MSAMNYLSAQSFVDLQHMGLFGWSYGGFLTTDFMLNHPNVFKVAVAGGPVMNWQYYEIMYGERYMDTPQENPDGYAATDLTNQVSKLKGKLLLIHGIQRLLPAAAGALRPANPADPATARTQRRTGRSHQIRSDLRHRISRLAGVEHGRADGA